MELSEAEIQILARLQAAEADGVPRDAVSLREYGECYGMFLEDWSGAFASLTAKGLIDGDDSGYRLTADGRPLGGAYLGQRPDLYWYYYQKFYPAAYASAAHSRLCEYVFGQDLCQEGQVDMTALHDLLSRLNLTPDDQVLDLGCGAGVISKYISEETGARVTGLDYSASAIAEARDRNAGNSTRLNFVHGDINQLDLPARSFSAVISLDTLYWASDLTDALSRIVRLLKPGGQMGIFMSQDLRKGGSPDILKADNTDLARALSSLELTHDTIDYSGQNARFWRRIQEAASDLRDAFEAEGNGFIAANLLREAEEDHLPETAAGTITRYLYHVRT